MDTAWTILESDSYITRNTVKTHLQRIYRKTGVSSKQEIIAMIDGDSDDPRGVLKIG